MNKDVSDRAKPCPLCGGKDIHIEVEDMTLSTYTMYIKCAKCGLKGGKDFLHSTYVKEGEEELIKYWNTRKLEKKPKTIASASYNAGYEAGHREGFSEGFQDGKEETTEPQGEWQIHCISGCPTIVVRTCPKCGDFTYIDTQFVRSLKVRPNFCDNCGARLTRKKRGNKKIKYRPHRPTLADSMEEYKEFDSVADMLTYIEQDSGGLISSNDITIDKSFGSDDRIGWKSYRYVCTTKYGGVKYGSASMCIGYCDLGEKE